MSQNNAKIIIVLLAVAIGLGCYLGIINPKKQVIEDTKSEISSLETRLNELRTKEANRKVYLDEISEYNLKTAEIIADYPENLAQEYSVDFFRGVDEKYGEDFYASSVGLGQPSVFYTLGTSGYECKMAAFPVTYTGSYNGIKDLLLYVSEYKERINIDSISISYDESNDIYSGSINLNAYSVEGSDRVREALSRLDVVPTGVDNLFLGGKNAAKNQNFSYDADQGATIKTVNDVRINIVNAANDATAGIVIAGGDKEVKSTNNSVEKVNLTVFEKDKKYYATYSVGKDEATVELKSKDVKVYVTSSDRVDANDKNGVKLSIDNQTDIPVFVKVDGDSEAKRFSLGSKTGIVKVY